MNQLQQLQAVVANLNQRDQDFANSLLNAATTRQLSEKQTYWVGELIKRGTPAPKPENVAIGNDTSVAGIMELIHRNNKAKRPKIRMMANDTEVIISKAGAQARFPGTISIAEANGRKNFLGRIHLDGKFEPGRILANDARWNDSVVAALKELAANPEQVAASYGKKTGHCCFCSLPLDDARSLEVGYGPVCAKNYSLPWGNRKIAA